MTTSEESARRLVAFAFAVKRAYRKGVGSPGDSLSEERFRTLSCLKGGGGSSLKNLASRMGTSTSSLCIMLTKLEGDGLVERSRDPGDRRSVRYDISPQGRELVTAEFNARLTMMAARLEVLSTEEREDLNRALDTSTRLLDRVFLPES